MTESWHILIYGKVQGVYFRSSTRKVAHELGISGWVQNLPNSCVEIHAEGSRNDLLRFMDWCKVGPSTAKVTQVVQSLANPEFSTGFRVLY